MMRAEAFVPGHITGFFEVFQGSDPMSTGSKGCGVVLTKGSHTKVEVREEDADHVEVYVNGSPCDCPVTRSVIRRIAGLTDFNCRVRVEHFLELPMKFGFGMSGAGALGTALALNRALELGLSLNSCGRIAHEAEVSNGTGLGDVIAQINGGLVLRVKPGGPGVGRVEKIPADCQVVVFIVGGELDTKGVLSDREKVKRINRAGRRSFEAFLKQKSIENFLRVSWNFTRETGLANEKIYLAANSLANNGVIASMAMLGNAVFTLTEEPSDVLEMLDYPYFIAGLNNEGVKM